MKQPVPEHELVARCRIFRDHITDYDAYEWFCQSHNLPTYTSEAYTLLVTRFNGNESRAVQYMNMWAETFTG